VPRIPLLLPMLAYWLVNVLATLATGGDVARGLSLDLITLDLIALYAALVWYLSGAERLLWSVRLWLGVATGEAVIGIAAFGLYLRTHSVVPGVQLEPVTRAPMAYGTMYEANIFGSFMCASFLLALAMATDESTRHKGALYLACIATALGLLLSATRSAWGSAAVGIVLLLLLLRLGRTGPRARRFMRIAAGLVAVGLVVGIGLLVAPPSVTGALGARARGLLNFGSGSGYGRVLLYKEALTEWSAQPLLGLGPGSFSYRLPGDTSPGPAWLPNLTLQVLHDTGILGLLALVWVFAAFFVAALRTLRRAPPGRPRTALAGLTAAVAALLISFQLTPGLTLGYSWALLALGVAATQRVWRLEVR
jgi:O-antigen ligase